MDVTWTWKLPILLIVTCPLLGCDVLRFGAKCQDHSRCSNDSLYATFSIENESNCNEGNSRHGLNALGRLPHDVRCSGHEERLSLGEMDFTNRFNTCPAIETVGNLPCDDIISGFTNRYNTCPANETVGNLPCDDIVSDITGVTTLEPDLGYTFVLDILGACFNVTVIEVNGERIDYSKMSKKLKFDVKLVKTNQSELDENYDSYMMIVRFPSKFVVKISENNTRLLNVTAVSLNGFCDWVGKWRENAQDFTLDQQEKPGKNFIPSVKLATWYQNLTVSKFIELVFVVGTLWWTFLSLMFWLIQTYLQQRGAVYDPPAPAG